MAVKGQEHSLNIPPVAAPPVQPAANDPEDDLQIPLMVAAPPVQPAANDPEDDLQIPLIELQEVRGDLADEPHKLLGHLFAEGQWIPSADPLTIGATNFFDMSNLRFGERCLEGVPGYTKINTTALSTYLKIRSGIQLKAPFTTKSRVLVQAYNTGLTASQILQNVTAIPSQGDFSATALHTDSAGAGLGRFAKWPGNQIAYCNGVESKIYGGDEIPVAAFLTSSAAVTGATLTDPRDYSEQVRNNLQTSDQVAVIGGGNDAFTVVLLDFETKDAAKIADISVGGAGANDAAPGWAADWSTDWAKFGTKSGKISAPGDAFSIADSANLDFGAGDGAIDFQLVGHSGVLKYKTGSFTYASGTGKITGVATDFASFAVGDSFLVKKTGTTTYYGGHITAKAGDSSDITVVSNLTDGWSLDNIHVASALCGRYQDGTNYWYLALSTSADRFLFCLAGGGAPTFYTITAAHYGSTSEGEHIALSRNTTASELSLFVGGLKTVIGNLQLPDLAAALTFGRAQWAAAAYAEGFQDTGIYFDEFRVSKGSSRYSDDFDPPVQPYETPSLTFLAGFTRPVQAVTLYLKEKNVVASTLTGKQHNGHSWSAITITDGTKPGTVAMAQNGSLSFASTVDTSVAKLLEGRVLYWYQFTLSAGAAKIYQVTGDAPFQDVRDVWDGTGILLSSCLVYVVATTSYKDFTLQAAEYSELTVIELDALATTEHILFGSPVPLMGFNIRMSTDAAKVNGNAAVMSVNYCNGNAIASWPSATSLTDGTSADSKSMKQSGTVSFTPVSAGQEFKVAINGGESMHYYKLSFSAALSATVEAWYITGIPAPQKIKPYKFPFSFLGRAMLCGYLAGNEGNRVDYSMNAAADVWNGPDSSGGADNESLYFGGSEELTSACEVYNRLGSSIYSFAIFTKDYETYILNGYDAETYRIFPISSVYGCPAPLTMDTYQVGVSKDAQSVRSIAMWLSHSGPVMFDSGGLMPVPGLECYFDKRDSRCINSTAIKNSRGWFDPDTGDYNLQIPSGSGRATNNVWVALSLKHQKWYRIVPAVAENTCLGAAFRVSDTDGRQYVYGARDNGYMMRIHDPAVATWDGVASVQSVTLGDLICSENIWDRIRLLFLKLFGISTTEDLDAAVMHCADGAASATTLAVVALNATPRYFKNTQPLNLAAWSHQIKISATVTTEARGMRLLGWGLEYMIEREDL